MDIADKFDAVDHDVSSQMKGLLVEPWQLSAAARDPEPSYLIIVDALDEIQNDGGSEFLRDLLITINEFDLRGFKFLMTSRSDLKGHLGSVNSVNFSPDGSRIVSGSFDNC